MLDLLVESPSQQGREDLHQLHKPQRGYDTKEGMLQRKMMDIIEYLQDEGPVRVLDAIKDLHLATKENHKMMNELVKDKKVVFHEDEGGHQWYMLPKQEIPKAEKETPKEEKPAYDELNRHVCIDCGTPLKSKSALRCNSCAAKHRMKKRTHVPGTTIRKKKQKKKGDTVDREKDALKQRYLEEREKVSHLSKLRERDKIVRNIQLKTISTLQKEAVDEMHVRMEAQQKMCSLRRENKQQKAKIEWLCGVFVGLMKDTKFVRVPAEKVDEGD